VAFRLVSEQIRSAVCPTSAEVRDGGGEVRIDALKEPRESAGDGDEVTRISKVDPPRHPRWPMSATVLRSGVELVEHDVGHHASGEPRVIGSLTCSSGVDPEGFVGDERAERADPFSVFAGRSGSLGGAG
jgi:hypothetical protein